MTQNSRVVEEPSLNCLEVIGPYEIFDDRGVNDPRIPYRRLCRFRQSNGPYTLGLLTDFGTARERWAMDDSWREKSVHLFLQTRKALASRLLPPPLAEGVIVPPNEGAPLPEGHWIPPGHLEALPRIYMVDKWFDGVPLGRLVEGPPLTPAAARGLLAAIGNLFLELAKGKAWSNLALEFWLLRDGSIEARPSFQYIESGDYLYSLRDFEFLSRPQDFMRGEWASAIATLKSWTGVDGEIAKWATALAPYCKALAERADAWPASRGLVVSDITGDQKVSLAAHMHQYFQMRGGQFHDRGERVLAAPPPNADVRRWQTRER